MKKQYLLVTVILILFLTSCSLIGLNRKLKTPKRPGKYPVFTEADTLRGKLTKYRKNFDVTFYEINVDLNIEDRYIKGHVDIYFNPLTDLDTIQIDLYKNLKINKIVNGTDSLTFTRKFNAVFVSFKNKIKVGEKTKITVYYEGKPIKAPKPPWDGGFVWKKDKNKNPWIGVSCELDGASLWWPLKDHLSDEPDSLKMNITIPEGLFCVSNGQFIKKEKTGNKETFSWKTTYPINTYDATIYIGKYEHFTIPYPKSDTTYNLDFYVLPYNLDKAKTHFKQTVDILKFYESKFGEYPWPRDGYKLVESPYEGMENQTAIAYGNNYKNEIGYDFDYIILHESAHEWWGNSVTAGDYADIWLHEGFATYSEALYVEYTKGYEAYLDYLSFYAMLIKNKRPVVGPYDVNYWDYNDGDVYFKGALMLHTLRNQINNDTLFFDIIKTFYSRYKYSIATTKEFIALVNEKTKKDYQWFFDQYLYSRACPQLEWAYNYKGDSNQNVFSYKWNNSNNNFRLAVKVKTGDGVITLYPSNDLQTINLISGDPVYANVNESYISLKRIKLY